MNKVLKNIIGIIAMVVTLALINTKAYAVGASLTGPAVVRAGDTIELKLQISDSGKYGAEGTFNYDANQVVLKSVVSQRSGWKVEVNGNTLVAYDDNLANPTSGSSLIATATFQVKNNVAAGTAINISVSGFTASDGSVETNYGTVSYSVIIAKPLSGVNTLSNITVAGYTLTPNFSADVTTYSIDDVDFSVSNLSVSGIAADATAKVSVSGTNLSVGANTVTITVTAENGSTKKYYINVTRKQDPNYVASSNANISQINVSNGKLSPSFTPDVTEYVVYVPYEEAGTSFSVSGSAADPKATGVTNGNVDALAEGINVTKIICTAEDGSTKEYVVKVVVMPQYSGEIPAIGENMTEEITKEPTTEQENVTEPATEPATEEMTENEDSEQEKEINNQNHRGVPVWLVILLAFAGVLVGFGVCYLFVYKKSR